MRRATPSILEPLVDSFPRVGTVSFGGMALPPLVSGTRPVQKCGSPDTTPQQAQSGRSQAAKAMVALHDFDPSVSLGCVRLVTGQIVQRYLHDASGWSDVAVNDQRGWVPTSFLMGLDEWNERNAAFGHPTSLATDKYVRLQDAPAPPSAEDAALPLHGPVAPLYIPTACSAMLDSCVHTAQALYQALCAQQPTRTAAQAFVTSVLSLLYDLEYVHQAMSPRNIRERDSLLMRTGAVAAFVDVTEATPPCAGLLVAVDELNGLLCSIAKFVCAVSRANSHCDYEAESNAVDSGETSRASSLLDELSLNDTSSTLRNSSDSTKEPSSIETPPPIGAVAVSEARDTPERVSDVLVLSPAQVLATARAAYDQLASVTAAFLGQVHMFEDFMLLSAFQRLLDMGLELLLSSRSLMALVESLGPHLDEEWVPARVAREYIDCLSQLAESVSNFAKANKLSAEGQHAVLNARGTQLKKQLIHVSNMPLCTSTKVMRSMSTLLERAPSSLALRVYGPPQSIQALQKLCKERATPVRNASAPVAAKPAPINVLCEPKRTASPQEMEDVSPKTTGVLATHGALTDSVVPIRRPSFDAPLTESFCSDDSPSLRVAASEAQSPAPSDDLLRNAKNDVVGGTLPALVRWLCEEDRSAHSLPVRAFFLNFRFFTYAEALVETILSVYHDPVDWHMQLHAVHFAFAWLKHYWLALDDSCALRALCDFVQQEHDVRVQPSVDVLSSLIRWRLRLGHGVQFVQLQLEPGPEGPEIQSVLLMPSGERLRLGLAGNENVEDKVPLTDGSPIYASTAGSRSRSRTPNLSKTLLSALDSSDIYHVSVLDLDPMDLAQQITIVESRLFSSIMPNELLFRNQCYMTSHTTTSMSSAIHSRVMSTLTTQITNWIGECILRETELKRRVSILKYFVRLGSAALELQNYNLLMAVQGALNSSTILRLKRTWAGLSSKALAAFEEQRVVMEHTRNFATYRARLRTAQGPVLPFLGLVLTDVTFCVGGNPKTRTGSNGTSLINFARCTKLASILGEVQRFQAHPFDLVEVPEIQCFLTKLRNVSALSGSSENYAAAAEQLYQRSLQLEPRENGTPMTRQRSNSIVPLPWNGARRNSSEALSTHSSKSADSKPSRLEMLIKRW